MTSDAAAMTSDASVVTAPLPTVTFAPDIDPVRFEVIRNALLAITEEMGATLRRAAYSTNIKTRGDFSCAFFDRQLRTIAQAFAQPSHLGSLAHIVPRAIAAYGAENLRPGDGILINDPYLGGVHLNDITLITPVFHNGDIFGYLANIAHHVDVGGGAPGSIGVSNEIYQEGVVIPPIRFVKEGQIDRDIFALIRANFRGTKEISGDFRAQTAANRLGWQRLEALLVKYGGAEFERYVGELLNYTERSTAAAFAQFPEGRFTAESYMDGDGIRDEPIKLAATLRIERGRVCVDLTGCTTQRPSPTNATFSQTYSGVVYVLKCLIDPDIPVNDGFYRFVDIRATPGTVMHAQHPAAVAAGWEVAMQVCDLLFKALSVPLSDRVLAGTKGCICNIAFGGIHPATDEYFTFYETIAGGYGATRRNDGMDAVQAHFQNTENAPVEETEANYPVRILRYELIPDSEGAGTYRGGLGVRRDYTFPGHTPSFSILSDKAKYPPWGLFGGGAARAAKYVLNPDTPEARELPSKITLQLTEGDIVSVQTPGGGGSEPGWRRPVAQVVADVSLGKISPERARLAYGVVLDPVTLAVDEAATARQRAQMTHDQREMTDR
jgi:N-methylhydantoinase B